MYFVNIEIKLMINIKKNYLSYCRIFMKNNYKNKEIKNIDFYFNKFLFIILMVINLLLFRI